MKIQLETGFGQNVIRAYEPGKITVNQQVYTRSLVVTPVQIDDWAPETFAALNCAHFEAIAALGAEVVIIGTGARQRFPDAEVLAPLVRAGIGYEIMDTGAACRTYNILVNDGRRVAAALLMIEEE